MQTGMVFDFKLEYRNCQKQINVHKFRDRTLSGLLSHYILADIGWFLIFQGITIRIGEEKRVYRERWVIFRGAF